MRVQFGRFELDQERYLLLEQGERVRVRPKVFDLLVYLVRCRYRVVLREELVASLWGGMAVGPGSLSGLVNELRQVLGEGGRSASSIRTVHARGYQFVDAVVEYGAASREGLGPPRAIHGHPSGDEGRSAGIASDSMESSALWTPLRNALEAVSADGARALLVTGVGVTQQPVLFDRARRVIEGAGFDVQCVPRASGAEAEAASLVDRIVTALIECHGSDRIRAMLPVHARSVMETSSRQAAIRLARSRDPLAARQHEEGIWRGLAVLLRRLAGMGPLAVVVEEIDLGGELETAPIAALLRLLADTHVLFVGDLGRTGLARIGEGRIGPSRNGRLRVNVAGADQTRADPDRESGLRDCRPRWDEIPDDVRSRIDLVELGLPDPSALELLVAKEGCSALPPVLADALLEHARMSGDIDLESVAEWLRIERGSKQGDGIESSPSAMNPVGRARGMRSVSADTTKRRSRREGR